MHDSATVRYKVQSRALMGPIPDGSFPFHAVPVTFVTLAPLTSLLTPTKTTGWKCISRHWRSRPV